MLSKNRKRIAQHNIVFFFLNEMVSIHWFWYNFSLLWCFRLRDYLSPKLSLPSPLTASSMIKSPGSSLFWKLCQALAQYCGKSSCNFPFSSRSTCTQPPGCSQNLPRRFLCWWFQTKPSLMWGHQLLAGKISGHTNVPTGPRWHFYPDLVYRWKLRMKHLLIILYF